MIILQQQSTILDNSTSSQDLPYDLTFEPIITIPHDVWIDSGEVTLITIVRTVVTFDENPSGATKFRNPTSRPHGQAAILSDGFVVDQKTISYEKQQLFTIEEKIAIENVRGNIPKRYGRDSDTKPGHSFSVSDIGVCGLATGLIVQAPLPSTLSISATVSQGGICLRELYGEESYTEIQLYEDPLLNIVEVGRSNQSLITTMSGVLYPYKSIGVEFITGFRRDSNLAPLQSLPIRIIGSAPFPVYNYVCTNGIPVSQPTNPPCLASSISVVQNPDGTASAACLSIVP